MLALCVLRWADATTYRKLMTGDIDSADASYCLVEALSLDERLANGDRIVVMMVASLLRLDPDAATSERLVAAGIDGDAADAIVNLFQGQGFVHHAAWHGLSRDRFFETVELLAGRGPLACLPTPVRGSLTERDRAQAEAD